MPGTSTDARGDIAGDAGAITARLFGAAEIRVGDRLLGVDSWPRRTARSLLLLLLSTPGHLLRRDEVVETLWTELTPDAALNELYKALHTLRRVLEPDLQRGSSSRYLRVANETIAILPAAISDVDVTAFESALARAASADQRSTFAAPSIAIRAIFLLTSSPSNGRSPVANCYGPDGIARCSTSPNSISPWGKPMLRERRSPQFSTRILPKNLPTAR